MTTTAPTTARVRDLMRSVLLNPLDLLARFELADAIEDDMLCDPADAWPAIQLPSGVEVERDERGMPWGIRCRMEDWCEEPMSCGECGGAGEYSLSGRPEDTVECAWCNPSAWNYNGANGPGFAARVCRVWPVGSVVLTDVSPWLGYSLFKRGEYADSDPEPNEIDDDLFEMMKSMYPENYTYPSFGYIKFKSYELFSYALNRAAINLGRKRSGLPILSEKTPGSSDRI